MGQPSDRDKDYMKEVTLITEISSEKYLKKSKKLKNYEIPENRYSRPCGGIGGFDDFVERWHE